MSLDQGLISGSRSPQCSAERNKHGSKTEPGLPGCDQDGASGPGSRSCWYPATDSAFRKLMVAVVASGSSTHLPSPPQTHVCIFLLCPLDLSEHKQKPLLVFSAAPLLIILHMTSAFFDHLVGSPRVGNGDQLSQWPTWHENYVSLNLIWSILMAMSGHRNVTCSGARVTVVGSLGLGCETVFQAQFVSRILAPGQPRKCDGNSLGSSVAAGIFLRWLLKTRPAHSPQQIGWGLGVGGKSIAARRLVRRSAS